MSKQAVTLRDRLGSPAAPDDLAALVLFRARAVGRVAEGEHVLGPGQLVAVGEVAVDGVLHAVKADALDAGMRQVRQRAHLGGRQGEFGRKDLKLR